MNFELMKERARYLKEDPKGVNEMCRIFEDMVNETLEVGMKAGIELGRKEVKKDMALRMLDAGKYDLEEITAISGLSAEELEKLRAERNS